MGRIIMAVTVWLVMAAMMLVIALPVIAKNSGEQKQAGVQGPPALSGQAKPGTSPEVSHGNDGACVLHQTGKETGGGCVEVT